MDKGMNINGVDAYDALSVPLLPDAIRRARRVYIVGNGGSYANAIHICNDLLSCGIKAYTLDPATLTASANDFGYETVFERWIHVVGERGDLLIVLSGSGNSPNVIRALREAKGIGMCTFAVLGYPAGKAASIADVAQVAGPNMQIAENLQLEAGHEAMQWLKSQRQ